MIKAEDDKSLDTTLKVGPLYMNSLNDYRTKMGARMSPNFRGFRLTVLFLFALYSLLYGQLNRSVVEGLVTDPQGTVVPDVEVTITNIETGIVIPTKTNGAGYYRLPDLVPGQYRAHFLAKGFAPLDVTEIQLAAGKVIRTDAQLKLGTTLESVQVTAEAPALETAASNFSTTVETQSVNQLPLQGRDLQQLVYLVPGIAGAGPPGSNFGFN